MTEERPLVLLLAFLLSGDTGTAAVAATGTTGRR